VVRALAQRASAWARAAEPVLASVPAPVWAPVSVSDRWPALVLALALALVLVLA
jgi:hypothetical protein